MEFQQLSIPEVILVKPDIIEDQDPFISSTSVIASFPISNNINIDDNTVTLKFLNPTWIQLRDSKNNVIIGKLMSKKDEYSYKISENLNLTAGNAGNIIILLDGEVKGKAGKIGEVIDSLIIDNSFNN